MRIFIGIFNPFISIFLSLDFLFKNNMLNSYKYYFIILKKKKKNFPLNILYIWEIFLIKWFKNFYNYMICFFIYIVIILLILLLLIFWLFFVILNLLLLWIWIFDWSFYYSFFLALSLLFSLSTSHYICWNWNIVYMFYRIGKLFFEKKMSLLK